MNPLEYCKLSKKALLTLKPLLDEEASAMENTEYILDDPVQFMYRHHRKTDREIAGFLAALMAWGRRDIVIAKTNELLQRMDQNPTDFVRNFDTPDQDAFHGFVHRTFNQYDIIGLIKVLQRIIREHEDLESFWAKCYQEAGMDPTLLMSAFRRGFLGYGQDLPQRTYRHITNPEIGSASKRLWMLLRWCLRQNSPADPGIWTFMPASQLRIPLDVHVARQSRELGLLKRKSNDRLAVEQLTAVLRLLNPEDPVRYDYALFGIGLRSNREKGSNFRKS